MVVFADLRDARPDALTTAAGVWDRLAGKARTLEQDVLADLGGPLRNGGWQGDAADAALTRIRSLHDEFELYAVKARNTAAVLHQAAATFGRLQRNLQAAVEEAAALGLLVSADGRVTVQDVAQSALSDQGALDTHRLAGQNAAIYDELITSIVQEAERADQDVADTLHTFAPDAQGINAYSWSQASEAAQQAAAMAGLSAGQIPAAGTDPHQAAAWWKSLTADQRDLLLTAYPALIGQLDGLPTLDRDRANRMALHEQIGDWLNNRQDPNDPHQQRLANLLNKLNDGDYSADQPLYLLGFNNDGDGQAIVAVGNPDTARDTAILVPGVSTNLDGIRGQINRAAAVQQTAESMGNGDVAVVAWLGYDPPQLDSSVVTAAGSQRAQAGAVSLDSFATGLHVSHDAGPVHMTAIGHSYGSVVIGDAASGVHHLAVDDIVTAGSPGMDVDNAAQLNVGARHVWAGAATDDPVASPGTAIPYVGTEVEKAMAIGHDTEPHQPQFGGNVYHVDTQGHSGYWTPRSDSLKAQAKVTVGDYQAIPLDYGKSPS